MNAKQFFDKELVNKLKEYLRYAKQISQEERMILVDCLRDEASHHGKDIVQITLSKLADYIEKLEVSE